MGPGPNLGLRANNIAKTVFLAERACSRTPLCSILRCAFDMSGEELLADWEVLEEAAQFPETGGLFRIDWQLVPGRLIGSVLPEETEALSTARAAPAGFSLARAGVVELGPGRLTVGSRRVRGRVGKILAIFLGGDAEATEHFHRDLLDECTGCQRDWCTVCHEDLHGYQDATCVMCSNTAVCSDCVQVFDAETFEREISAQHPNKLQWDPVRAMLDQSPVKQGEHVCLQCGLYSPTKDQRRKFLIFEKSCLTTDALLSRQQSFGLLTLAFGGWGLSRRMKKLSTNRVKDVSVSWDLYRILDLICAFLSFDEIALMLSARKSPFLSDRGTVKLQR